MGIVEQAAPFALCCLPTLKNTQMLSKTILKEGTPGDFVECGVFAGSHPAVMATVIEDMDRDGGRMVHLFDSFEGIPSPGPNDNETITGCIGTEQRGLVSTGVSVCSLEKVRRNMRIFGVPDRRLVYHKGWFQNTVQRAVVRGQLSGKKIAMLRLDGDLYESTMVCLEHLHPLVPRGGFVVIDDYALTGCRLAVTEYHAKHALKPQIISIRGGGGPVYYRK